MHENQFEGETHADDFHICHVFLGNEGLFLSIALGHRQEGIVALMPANCMPQDGCIAPDTVVFL